jgi:hypothetical protein
MLLLKALPLDCPEAVYPDDANPDVFYAIPAGPRPRRTSDGAVALVFHKYRFLTSDGSGVRGGGFLDLQSELVLDAVGRDRVLALLRARPEAAGRTPELRAPIFLEGTAELVTSTPGGNTTDPAAVRLTSPVSVVADNTAAFSETLSVVEAQLLWSQLHTAPTPVALSYALTVLARPAPGHAAVPGPMRVTSRLSADLGGTYREVDIDAAVFERLEVTSGCNVDFARNEIKSVTLHLRYGDRLHSAVFTDTTTKDHFSAVLDPALGHTYRYRVVIQFLGTGRQLELPEVASDRGLLTVSIGDVGQVRIDVLGVGLDWARTDLVTVYLTYADPARGVPAREDAVVLRPDAPDARYERAVWVPVDQPWSYRAVHVFRDGRRVDGPAATRSGHVLVVEPPFDRYLDVRLHGTGFDTAAMHRVECAHETAGGVEARAFVLTAAAPDATWSVGLLPGEDDDFRYRVLTVRTDGQSDQGDWQTAGETRTILIGAHAPRLSVTVVADLLDLDVVRLAQATLRHVPSTGPQTQASLLFQRGRPLEQVWTAPLADGDSRSYSWSVRYFLADGTQRAAAGEGTDSVLVLELPKA